MGEARRITEILQKKYNSQQLNHQKVANLRRASEEEEFKLVQLETRHGRLDVQSVMAWELDLEATIRAAESNPESRPSLAENLPSAAVLRARFNALRSRTDETRRFVAELKEKSTERELKYRRLVSLCTRRPEAEVDALLDTLTRAVESEIGDVDITRIRRFLGGVEAVQ